MMLDFDEYILMNMLVVVGLRCDDDDDDYDDDDGMMDDDG